MRQSFNTLLATSVVAATLIAGEAPAPAEAEPAQASIETAHPVPYAQIGALARRNAGGGVSAPHRGHRHPAHPAEGGISVQHDSDSHSAGGISPQEA